MKKRTLGIGLLLTGFALTFGAFLVPSSKAEESLGYSATSVPTTNIDLNDSSASTIRNYYSSLNNKSQSELQGTNLLKNLKTILKNGQKYFSYDSGNGVWQMYEITDRDWTKSPASAISGYNASTNKISSYTYGTSTSSKGTNPYIHALYHNRNVTNKATAWDSHGDRDNAWTIEREHIWPKSQGFEATGQGGARGDPFELQAADGTSNGMHSNLFYGYVDKTKTYKDAGSTHLNCSGNLTGKSLNLNGNTVFEPQDSDKGDIARAIFYMVARYNYLSGSDSDGIGSNNPNLTLVQEDNYYSSYTSSTSQAGKMGILTDLLAWHHADPVDQYEIHRNNLIYNNFSKNRNPFIDFPEWADFIWGSVTYNGRAKVSYSSTPTGYAQPSTDTINGYNSGGGETVSVTGVSLNKNTLEVEEGKSETLIETVAPANATNQSVTWSSSNNSIATVSNGLVQGVSQGSATITVTTVDGGFTASCSVTVTESQGGDEQTEDGSVDAASGALSGWTASGTGSAYADGSVRFDGSGDNVYKTDIFSAECAAGMTSLTVTINSKINGTPTAANSYKVEALDASGNVLASDVKTGADIVTTSYGDTIFTIDSGLTGCTGIKITYVTKGGGNWGIKSVSWVATYSSGEEVTLTSIAVKTAPSKLTYTVGDGFDPNGLVITGTYSDSSTTDIPYEDHEDEFEFNPADNLQTTDVSVTISYGGKTCTQAISVAATKTLSSITINTDNVTKSFYVDDVFEHDNLVVTAHFSDSSTDVVSSSSTVSNPDMTTAGDKTITVSYTYGGSTKTASYTITVLESGGSQTGSFTWDLSIASYNTPTSAALVTWSSDCATLTAEQGDGKTAANNYLGGDSNARTSSRFYSGNTMRYVPAENYEITSVVFTATSTSYATALGNSDWTNATASASGTTVTITPTDGSVEFYAVHGGTIGGTSIVVNYSYTPAATLSSISLDTSKVQTTFSVGDTFNYTGLVVTASYTDGSSKVVTPTSVSTPSTATTGNKDVTVTYTENEVTKTRTYTITVTANPSISWTAPTINVYSESTLSGTDVNAWAVTYNDGAGHQTVLTYSQITVKLGGTTISIPHTWAAEDDGKTLTATYSSLTTSESSAVQITQSVNPIMKTEEPSSKVSDLTFTAACGGSGTADDGKTWTVTSDGTESSFDTQNGKGIHYGTSSATVQYIKLTSNVFTSGKITKVEVNASTASGVSATVSVTVGGEAFGGDPQNLTSSAVPDNPYTFTGNVDADTIEVLITKPSSATKAIYCKSVKVTYTTSGSSVNIANSLDHIAAQRVAVKFAKAFNAAMDTTSGCTTNLSSAWATCSSAYDTFLSEAAALGSAEEAYAKDLIKYATAQYSDDSGEACIERMMKTYEICVQKHGQTGFMNELVELGKAPTSVTTLTLNNTTNITIIVVVSVIMIAAVGGYFCIRRYKQK